MSGVTATGRSLVRRVLDQPKHVQKVADLVRTDGLSNAVRLVRERLAVELPTGYSGAGTVVEVGKGVADFKIGDRAACAGAQCAFHAEFVCIPTNLAIKIPDTVGFPDASTVALGAIGSSRGAAGGTNAWGNLRCSWARLHWPTDGTDAPIQRLPCNRCGCRWRAHCNGAVNGS
ncbi:alcohol dehydrogenase catalytic domain-containing protein [Devosia algicola]|uniref:alcohol dehydrogenase catalytic domain-containing protein n=1 Tax=Devosia algicola TaxID=3026418 RepID=UPI0038994EC8